MAAIKDTIISQIPKHILESYPRFFEFLEAYYEWLGQEGNPYERIKYHMDHLSFEKSLDDYVDMMKREYLNDVPDAVLFDKEMFIKWSRQFNLARGSHASYKFLFRLLFGEQSTDIYVPKENILRTSDGNWISGENTLMVTHNADNPNQFQFQTIFQERPIYEDIVERAEATVQRVRTKYAGRYVVTELSIINIEGEFKSGFPIKTEGGAEEWMINSFIDVDITNPGSGYNTGQRVLIDGLTNNCVEYIATEAGTFDSRNTSFFDENDIQVFVNTVEIFDFTFDGRNVSSPSINVGDTVKVLLPSYSGYLVVDQVDENRGITNIEVIDLPIGCPGNYTVTGDGLGSGLVGKVVTGFIRPVPGYYEGTRGQLSSNMYLQDSFFYQNYSYVIRTQQDFTAYADIVKDLLHPSGFLMFGQISIISLIEILIEYVDETIFVFAPFTIPIVPKYGLGANYQFIDKFGPKTSRRLYKQSFFDSKDQDFVFGEPGYDLESEYLAHRIDTYQYNPLKGWMQKDNLSDYYLYVPEDYGDNPDSGTLYFETGYVSTRD